MDYETAKAYAENYPKRCAIERMDSTATHAGMPTYSELVAALQKVSNCATRATSTDSTGAPMVQMRQALLEQTRALLARLPK